ncbi:MAG: hypothetical protein ACI4RA_09630 [Kiritimatiellia bacterium]
MKLCSLIGVCALATAAFGGEVAGLESNVCGLMNVPSEATVTMIAVPWVGVGSGEAVQVANLVKTDTLSAGDELYYYAAPNYYRWVLTDDKTWEPSAVSNGSGTFVAPGEDYTIPRGKGLFIVRKDTSREIWLYGQHDANAVAVTIEAPADGVPVAYNMIANPNTEGYDLNAKGVEGAAGDQIILADGAIYNYNGTDWTKTVLVEEEIGGQKISVKVPTTEGVVIPAGQGAWYCSKGGKPTITW